MRSNNAFLAGFNSSKSWRDQLNYLMDAKKEYSTYSGMMTEYERTTVMEGIKDLKTSIFPVVCKGALSEFEQKIEKFNAAKAKTSEAVTKEINRWDAGKLVAEKQLVNMQLDEAAKTPYNALSPRSKTNILTEVVEQAIKSGDMYKIRAVAEKARDFASNVAQEDRIQAFSLVQTAENALNKIRNTPEISQALKDQNLAGMELQDARDELGAISMALGEKPDMFTSNNLTRAMRRIQISPAGLEVLAADDPQVTGVLDFSLKQDE